MLTDIWFTPGYTFANFWFSPGLGWRGPGRTPLPKNTPRARGGGGWGGSQPGVHEFRTSSSTTTLFQKSEYYDANRMCEGLSRGGRHGGGLSKIVLSSIRHAANAACVYWFTGLCNVKRCVCMIKSQCALTSVHELSLPYSKPKRSGCEGPTSGQRFLG